MINLRESINPKTDDRHVRIYRLDVHREDGPECPSVEVVFSKGFPPYINQFNTSMLSVVGAELQAIMLQEAVQIILHNEAEPPPTYPYEDFVEWVGPIG